MNEVFVVINYLVRHVRRFDKFVIKKTIVSLNS